MNQVILEDASVAILMKNETCFYASLLMSLECHYDDSVPTACTNGFYIKINPDWFEALSKDERIFLLLHEVLHVAYMHTHRLDGRDPKKWNQATDHAINLHLIDEGFAFIKGGLADTKYKDMSAEEIYSLIEDSGEDEPNILDGDLEQGDAEEEQQILDKVVMAAQQAEIMNQAGSIPQSILRKINEILYPKLPWATILQKYAHEKTKEDYSWTKRNRRYQDVYLPSLYSEQMGKVSIYVDASCSVSEAEFAQYLGEIASIHSILNPRLMEVISFDTQIYDVQEVHSGSPFDVSLVGGGGTCLREVAERVNETKADVVILFTDGYYTPVEYNCEVLHIIVGNAGYRNNQEQPVIHISI